MKESKRQIDNQKFFNIVNDLVEKTDRKMKDLYEYSIIRNRRNMATISFENGRQVKHNYEYLQNKIEISAANFQYILKEKGVEPGARVGFKYRNHEDWIVGFWALLMAGYSPALIDARSNSERTVEFLLSANIKVLLTSIDDKTLESEEITAIGLEHFARSLGRKIENPVWADEVLFFTSGTTGNSKVMIFNGESLCYQTQAALDMPKETTTILPPLKYGETRNLASIPFHHVFGFVAVFLWYTFFGATIVFPSSFAPNDIVSACKEGKVTHVYSVPLLWENINKSLFYQAGLKGEKTLGIINKTIAWNLGRISKKEAGIVRKKFVNNIVKKSVLGKHIKFCINGGGYLSTNIMETINGIGYPLYNGYGMTEFGVTSVELSDNIMDRIQGSIGHALHGVQYKVHQPNKEGIGELYVKSRTMHIKEIINGKEKDVELHDGYLATGDLVKIEEDGRVWIKGRLKDVIIGPDGDNLYPDEVESHFKNLPHVSNLAIIGFNQKETDKEKITLVLETKPLDDEAKAELRQKLFEINSRLPLGMMVEQAFVAKNPLPIANNMKIKRLELKKTLREKPGDFMELNNAKTSPIFDNVDQELIKGVIGGVREIFARVLMVPISSLKDAGDWVKDFGGDSMNYLQLLNEIEEHFEIEVDEEEYGNITTINDFALMIVRHKEKKEKSK